MEVQSKTVDDASSLTYHEMFDNTLQLTETLSWNKCHKVEVDSSGFYKITLYCSSALREEIGNDANKVNYIEKGSVVLLVSIANMASLSLQKLSKQVQLFVYMILEIPDINGRMKNDLDILLLPVDFVITTEKEYTMQCDNCDTLLLPDSKFCNKCGVHIDKKFICSNCNNTVLNEKNDCPKCGEQLRRDKLMCSKLDFKSKFRVADDADALKSTVNKPEQKQDKRVLKDSDTLKTTVNIPEQNRDSRFLQAQSAIKGLGSFQEVKQLMKKINEEGSEGLVEHINTTLDKWKKKR
ncbi:unnamed protein product [Mytilus edulis]|uniref:DZANK-type domain-containing protein n=1 Tax=Mytilus edulis TaxID=6550 RepID=A0A8S3U375_MYTED|nr:unnamed protein product [Mytilus edulis]